MSLPCRFAGCIIAKSIGTVTRQRGGSRAGIEPLPVALTLWRQTHPLGATVDRRIGEDAIGASPTEHPPRAGEAQRGEIDKTNPFPEVGQQ